MKNKILYQLMKSVIQYINTDIPIIVFTLVSIYKLGIPLKTSYKKRITNRKYYKDPDT